MSNVDKHRTLLEHTYQTRPEQIAEVFGWNPRANLRQHTINVQPISHEGKTEVARLRFSETGPDPQVYVKGTLTIYPMFGGAPSRADFAIHASLGTLRDIQVDIGRIIDKFQKFF